MLGGLLQALAELASLAEIIVPVYPSPAASVPSPAALGGVAGVRLLPPLPYAGFVALMGQVALVLTYSGGVQEEAPTIGLPCLVLRETTERREGLFSGKAALVGRDPAAIVVAVRRVLADGAFRAAVAAPALPYGNCGAARAINDMLLERQRSRDFPSSPRTSGSLSQSAVHHQ